MDPVELRDSEGRSGRAERAVVAGGLAAGVLLFSVLAQLASGFAARELGLGLNTFAFRAERGGTLRSGFGGDVPALLEEARAARRGGRALALWLGASQLHAINNPRDGDRLAVVHAEERAEARGAPLRYLQVTEPNANLHELLGVYLPFRPLRPEWVLLAVTYDDFQEGEIRGELGPVVAGPAREALAAAPAVARAPLERLVQAGARSARGALAPTAQPVQRSVTEGSPQEQLEAALVSGLERVWPAYAARGDLRSAAIAGWKLPLTQALFRVAGRRSDTRVDPARSAWNLEALEALVTLARGDGAQVLLYQAPHRPGESPFYHDRAAYDAFHADLRARAARWGAHTLDLETLIPAEVWGLTNNYLPDVFHFRGEGHARLGAAIDAWVERQAERR